jgi:hypothetical protein
MIRFDATFSEINFSFPFIFRDFKRQDVLSGDAAEAQVKYGNCLESLSAYADVWQNSQPPRSLGDLTSCHT